MPKKHCKSDKAKHKKGTKAYAKYMKKARFICQKCKSPAKKKKNLCNPQKL